SAAPPPPTSRRWARRCAGASKKIPAWSSSGRSSGSEWRNGRFAPATTLALDRSGRAWRPDARRKRRSRLYWVVQANQHRGCARARMSKHVAVLMGGWSAEREISLRSGKACAEALARLGHQVTRIDVGRDIAAVLTTVKPDLALNMLHGRPGEDGTLQGVLEILAIPYSHSGVMASALAMQKDVAKDLFRAAGVPVPEGLVASRFEVAKGHVLTPPYVIKPPAEGWIVGSFILRADQTPAPQELTREDWPYGERLIVEKYIAGKELTCAVMGDAALGVIEIVPTVRFYDYDAKYVPGGSKHLLPAPVSSIVYQ